MHMALFVIDILDPGGNHLLATRYGVSYVSEHPTIERPNPPASNISRRFDDATESCLQSQPARIVSRVQRLRKRKRKRTSMLCVRRERMRGHSKIKATHKAFSDAQTRRPRISGLAHKWLCKADCVAPIDAHRGRYQNGFAHHGRLVCKKSIRFRTSSSGLPSRFATKEARNSANDGATWTYRRAG